MSWWNNPRITHIHRLAFNENTMLYESVSDGAPLDLSHPESLFITWSKDTAFLEPEKETVSLDIIEAISK